MMADIVKVVALLQITREPVKNEIINNIARE